MMRDDVCWNHVDENREAIHSINGVEWGDDGLSFCGIDEFST